MTRTRLDVDTPDPSGELAAVTGASGGIGLGRPVVARSRGPAGSRT